MDLDDAMEIVGAGHAVARPSWADGAFLRWREGVNAQGMRVGWVAGPELTPRDLLADDYVDLGRLQ